MSSSSTLIPSSSELSHPPSQQSSPSYSDSTDFQQSWPHSSTTSAFVPQLMDAPLQLHPNQPQHTLQQNYNYVDRPEVFESQSLQSMEEDSFVLPQNWFSNLSHFSSEMNMSSAEMEQYLADFLNREFSRKLRDCEAQKDKEIKGLREQLSITNEQFELYKGTTAQQLDIKDVTNADLNSRLEQLEKDYGTIFNQLEKTNEEIKGHVNHTESLQADKERLSNEVVKLQTSTSSIAKILNDLRSSKHEELIQQEQSHSQEVNRIKQKLENTIHENMNLSAKLEYSNLELEKKKRKHDVMTFGLNQSNALCNELMKQNADLNAQVDKLELQLKGQIDNNGRHSKAIEIVRHELRIQTEKAEKLEKAKDEELRVADNAKQILEAQLTEAKRNAEKMKPVIKQQDLEIKKLSSDIENQREESQDLKVKIDEIKTDLKNNEDVCEKLKMESDRLELLNATEKSRYEVEKAELMVQINNFQESTEKLEKKRELEKEASQVLQRDLSLLKNDKIDLEKAMDKREVEVKNEKKCLEDKIDEITKTKIEKILELKLKFDVDIQNLTTEMEKMKDDLERETNVNTQLSTKLNNLEKSTKSLKLEKEQDKKENKRLKSKVQDLTKSKQTIEKALKEQIKKCDLLKLDVDKLTQLDSESEIAKTLKLDLDRQAEVVSFIRRAQSELQRDFSAAMKENDCLKKTYQHVENKLQEIVKKHKNDPAGETNEIEQLIDYCQDELIQLKLKLEAKRQENVKLQEQIDKSIPEFQASWVENDKNKLEIVDLQKKTCSLTQKNTVLLQDCDNLQTENNQLRSMVKIFYMHEFKSQNSLSPHDNISQQSESLVVGEGARAGISESSSNGQINECNTLVAPADSSSELQTSGESLLSSSSNNYNHLVKRTSPSQEDFPNKRARIGEEREIDQGPTTVETITLSDSE